MKKHCIKIIIFCTLFLTTMVSSGRAKESITIFGPRYKGVDTGFAERVFTAFEKEVVQSGRFKVMLTNEAMEKWKNVDTELDPKCRNPICLVVIAQKLGVEKIILPYIKLEEGQVLFGYRCFEEVNGKFSSENITCLQGQDWRSEVNAFTERMIAELPQVGKIKSIKKDTASLDIGSSQGVNAGATFKVFRFKDVLAGKRYLFKGETKVGEIKITDVENNLSVAKIINTSRKFKMGDIILVKGVKKYEKKLTRKSPAVKVAAISPKTEQKDIKGKTVTPSKKLSARAGGTHRIYDSVSDQMIAAKKTKKQKTKGLAAVKKKSAVPKAVSKPVQRKVVKEKTTKLSKPATAKKPAKPQKIADIKKPVKSKKSAKIIKVEKKKKLASPAKKTSKMVFIPAGEFIMGSTGTDDPDESPQRKVFVGAFSIDRYEVTNAEYRKFVKATGRFTPDFLDDPDLGMDDHPVVGVSYEDAAAYAKWVGKRLPTEAEWEKAARGTKGRIYPWGSKNNLTRANHNTEKDGYTYTAPVNKLDEGNSPYGVMNMAGNVWEWCADFYKENYYSSGAKKNPKGPQKGTHRVIRGGSWDSGFASLRASNRSAATSQTRRYDLGFRCVK
jgi:iron(II)-dependent oxidoreductase